MLLWEWCCCLPGAVSTSVSDVDITSPKAYEPRGFMWSQLKLSKPFHLIQRLPDKGISQWGFLPKHWRGSRVFFQTRATHSCGFERKWGNLTKSFCQMVTQLHSLALFLISHFIYLWFHHLYRISPGALSHSLSVNAEGSLWQISFCL